MKDTKITREHANNIDSASAAWQKIPQDLRKDLCRNGGCTVCRFGQWEGGSYGTRWDPPEPPELACLLIDGTENIGESDFVDDNPDLTEKEEQATLDAIEKFWEGEYDHKAGLVWGEHEGFTQLWCPCWTPRRLSGTCECGNKLEGLESDHEHWACHPEGDPMAVCSKECADRLEAQWKAEYDEYMSAKGYL